jgi:hypothetical protein
MTDPGVRLELDGDRRAYRPGEVLSGSFRLESVAGREVAGVEVSVLWHTEGKGEEDRGVHHLEALNAEACRSEPEAPWRFAVRLPRSPLSYDGLLVKVRWCVRVRAVVAGWADRVAEVPFRLGDVAPPPEAS